MLVAQKLLISCTLDYYGFPTANACGFGKICESFIDESMMSPVLLVDSFIFN
tara:strand:+ start:768 stop:923 length:156 start_codon:yes stop_codon:yes gene_type:complete